MKWIAIAFPLLAGSALLLAVDKKAPVIPVFFSPAGGCTVAVVETLAHAKQSVLVQAYSFTSAPIASTRGGAESEASGSRSCWTRARKAKNIPLPISWPMPASVASSQSTHHCPQQGDGD